ncbi:MAG: hypothetical protein E6I91_01125 [Chloroflexi bacterium]|nr:MAG: hypothetical protein E6I91_01125 [Chloroflexota bacterium]
MTFPFCPTEAARLVDGKAEQVLLDAMLTLFKERGWLKERQRQRSDSTHVQDIRASDQPTHVRG